MTMSIYENLLPFFFQNEFYVLFFSDSRAFYKNVSIYKYTDMFCCICVGSIGSAHFSTKTNSVLDYSISKLILKELTSKYL